MVFPSLAPGTDGSTTAFPAANGLLQEDILRLAEQTGMAQLAKDVGFIDKNNEIDKLKDYEGAAQIVSSGEPPRRSARAPKPSKAAQGGHKRKGLESGDEEGDDGPAEKKRKLVTGKAVRGSAMIILPSDASGGKGLRHFSQKVCEKVQSKGLTTYNEVADELVTELNESGELGEQVDAKNIRRRVYDALNVLMALRIIDKEKKEIRWRGLPVGGGADAESEALKQEILVRRDRVKRKQEYLFDLEQQYILYRNLIERNVKTAAASGEENVERVQLPFIVIHTKKDTAIECEMNSDRTEYFFDFSAPFSIHDDNEILKRLGLDKAAADIKGADPNSRQARSGSGGGKS